MDVVVLLRMVLGMESVACRPKARPSTLSVFFLNRVGEFTPLSSKVEKLLFRVEILRSGRLPLAFGRLGAVLFGFGFQVQPSQSTGTETVNERNFHA
jgi:hypothetical protein